MRIVEQSRLVDALADWGRHEAMMRSGLPSETFDGADGFIEAVNFALQFRSPLVARILAGCRAAEIPNMCISAYTIQQYTDREIS